MIKTLFLALALLALSSAQDCNNPLLGVFGIPGLATPESGANLTFCPNLQAGQTCCSEETLQGLQTNLTTTSEALNTIAGDRDLYIAQLFFNITSNYTNLTNQLQDFNNDITAIQNTNPAIGAALRQQYNLFIGIANSLVTDETTFTQNFVDYQNARTTCWTTLLQIESSAWCLACDPNYAALGVQPDGSINSGDSICTAIQAACAPYLFDGLQFNALIQAQQTLARLNDTIDFLNAYRANNNQLPPGETIDTPPTETPQKTIVAPQGCTATACPWQCTNLFSDSFLLNATLAANGAGIIGGADIIVIAVIGPVPGVPTEVPTESEEAFAEETLAEEALAPTESTGAPVAGAGATPTEVSEAAIEELAEELAAGRLLYDDDYDYDVIVDDKWKWRYLQSGTWNPALNNSGFNVTVETDPANVSNADEGSSQPEITPTPTPQGATVVKATSSLLVILGWFML